MALLLRQASPFKPPATSICLLLGDEQQLRPKRAGSLPHPQQTEV
jgi:hypothetical protein